MLRFAPRFRARIASSQFCARGQDAFFNEALQSLLSRRVPAEIAVKLPILCDVRLLRVQRPVRRVVGHVEQKGFRLVALLKELQGEVGDEIGFVAAFGDRIRLPIAEEGRVSHIGEIVAWSLMPGAAKAAPHVPREALRVMPVLRREHVEPAHRAGVVARAVQHLEHRHAVALQEPGPLRHPHAMRMLPSHQRRPRGTAERAVVELREAHALRRQSVEVRRLDLAAVAAEV